MIRVEPNLRNTDQFNPEKNYVFIEHTDSRCTDNDNSRIDGNLHKQIDRLSRDALHSTLVSVMYFKAVNVNANGLCCKPGNRPSTQSVGAFV